MYQQQENHQLRMVLDPYMHVCVVGGGNYILLRKQEMTFIYAYSLLLDHVTIDNLYFV